MIPILFKAETEPERLKDVNGVLINDVNGVELYVAADFAAARTFETYGIGALTDCISCEVEEERNGLYELSMEYPDTGVHYDEMGLRCIIAAKPNYTDAPQPFRIYYISEPIDGRVTVNARHLSYDLSGVPVLPFKATSAGAACAGLTANAAIKTPFTVGTQVGTIADFAVDVPSSVRSWFGGKEGSLIDVYGGEWHYDGYSCTLLPARGEDRGVVIRYGVNLLDFQQEKNCEDTYTGVLPFWANEEGDMIRADIVNAPGSYDHRRILCLDLSQDYENRPTTAQLVARAKTYIKANNIGVPKVSISLDFVQIGALSDRVDLCDTVTVEFERLGVTATAKCIRTVWDVLNERYTTIEFGDAKTDITDTIAGLATAEEKAQTSVSPIVLKAIANVTAMITGNSGGNVVLYDRDQDGQPEEILIMDTDDIETATRVWRWNLAGLGYSNSGVGGPFGLAMTMDGQIVANFITAGTLRGVKIENGSGTFAVDEDGNCIANSFESSNAVITGGYLDIVTENITQGITLKNAAETTYTQHSASSRRRYSNNELILFETGGAISATSFNNISDRRKKDVLGGRAPDLSKIRAVRFRWKDNRDDLVHVGYIAQDVERVARDMVTEVEGVKTLDYIQVLVAKVEQLEREVAALKKEAKNGRS